MRVAYLLVLAGSLLCLDPSGADPARAKLAFLLPGLALLALALALTGSARPPPAADRLEALLVLAAGLTLARAALGPFQGRLEGLAAPLALAGSYLVARRSLSPAEATRALGALGVLAALATLAEPLLLTFRTATGTHPAGELVGPTANPALTAGVLALALPAAAGLSPLAAIPLVAALLGTLSRAGLLALAALAARRTLSPRAGLAGLGLGLVLLLAGRSMGLFDLGQLRSTRTLRARLDLHALLVPALADRPILGHGPGTVGIVYGEAIRRGGRPQTLPDRVDHCHDPPLQLALEHGVPGLLTGLAILAAILPRLRGSLAGPAEPAAAGLLAFGIVELVGTGSGSPLSLALAGLALAGLERDPDPLPASPAPALALGLALALLAPHGLAAARSERTRARILAAAAKGLAPPPHPLEELAANPEARLDMASAQGRNGELGAALAGWLAVESAFPGYGGAEQNRAAMRRWMGRESPTTSPSAP